MERNFQMIPSDGISFGNGVVIDALLKDTLSDIKDEMKRVAHERIPIGETGKLREFGIGEFGPTKIGPGIYRAGIGLRREPFYGIFVHDGTGIYGPRRSPIVPRTAPYLKFTIGNRTFRLKSVKGQEPQPFMTEAFEIVDRTYVPARLEKLKLAIKAFANN